MEKSHTCPFCKNIIAEPELMNGAPLFVALEEEIKDFAPEHADVLCRESSSTTLPQVEYQTKCSSCGKILQIVVFDLTFQCICSSGQSDLIKINDYKSFRVSKFENQNLRETRGLRKFLKGPEAAQAQFFLKVIHQNHIHAFCSRCGGPVMITFHGLTSVQETFEFACRRCGKYGIYNREPSDFVDKPLIESTRKNP